MGIAEFFIVVGTVLAGISGFVLYYINRIHTADWEKISSLKEDSNTKIGFLDQKISSLDSKVADVYTNMQAKVDKTEHRIELQRLETRINELSQDQKVGQSEIRQDLKDMRQDLMAAIRDIKQ